MKLVHIITDPRSLGFLRGQMGFVRDAGFDVVVVSSPGPKLDEFRDREGIPVIAVDMSRAISPLRDMVSLWRLWRLLRRLKPEIVHTHTPKAGLLGTLAAWLARVPVRIYHLRGLRYMTACGFARKLMRTTERISCGCAHTVFCVSRSLRDVAISEGLCSAEKCRIFRSGSGNGVDAMGRFNPHRFEQNTRKTVRSRYGIPTDATVVGFVGRVVRDKGVEELTHAWLTLRERHPALHVMVVGPLETEDPLPSDIVSALREDPRVHLTDVVWEIPPLYTAMDLVVLPSYREGFPNVPLEAAAFRLPVVATRIPGCVDAVEDGITGTLVPARNAPALCDAIARYVEDPQLRLRHGRAGRSRVLEEFRSELIWEEYVNAYRALIKRNCVQTSPDCCRTESPVFATVGSDQPQPTSTAP